MADALYVFAWDDIASDSFCGQVEQIADVTQRGTSPIRSLVSRILALVGGLPAATSDLSAQQRDALGQRLLLEACRHTLSTLSVRVERRGFVLQENHVVIMPRLNVNSASTDALAALPGVGKTIAERIVEERLDHGAFRSLNEFDQRVKGIGKDVANTLRDALSFSTPTEDWKTLPYGAHGLRECLSVLTSITRQQDANAQLVSALEIVASTCAATPHPARREKRMREYVTHEDVSHATGEVVVLEGSTYYDAVHASIGAAQQSVAVCMFHIAMPSSQHPTRRLLDALIAARKRGVSLRVLVDLDQKTDPYRSEIINKPALDYLKAHGVPCRSDERQRLLHSKFVLTDDDQVIIGSHNWSAGSYFRFDDASVLVRSRGLAASMLERYNDMWARGV